MGSSYFRSILSCFLVMVVFVACSQPSELRTHFNHVQPSETKPLLFPTSDKQLPVRSAPECSTACVTLDDKPIIDYAVALREHGKPKESLEFLKQCQMQCPRFACELSKAYGAAIDLVPEKEYVEAILRFTDECKKKSLATLSVKDLRVLSDLRREADSWTSRPLIRKTGWALIAIGTSFLVASILIGALGPYPYEPSPPMYTCSFAGVIGDKCIGLRYYTEVYVPLGVFGAGMLGTGIGLSIHYRF